MRVAALARVLSCLLLPVALASVWGSPGSARALDERMERELADSRGVARAAEVSTPPRVSARLEQLPATFFPEQLPSLWTPAPRLTAPDTSILDYVGQAVSVSGNLAVLGAPGHTISGNYQRGAAYVYRRSGGVWALEAKLYAPDGHSNDLCGWSVAASGDYVVVGCPRADVSNRLDQGAAYIFLGGAGGWALQAKVTASDAASYAYFGMSVALSGTTAAVGSPEAPGGSPGQGAAYVFVRSGTAWSQQQKVGASDGAAGDHFGSSLALDDDTLVVGAEADDIGNSLDQGSAYAFARSGDYWYEQGHLVASGASGSDMIAGVAVSVDHALVGAPGRSGPDGSDQGAAYLFVRNNGSWSQVTTFLPADLGTNAWFGYSVSLSGGLALVGAPGDPISGRTGQGSAYAYRYACGAWFQDAKLIAADGSVQDAFGAGVSASGGTALVGAPYVNVNDRDQGAGYVFDFSGDSRPPSVVITGPTSSSTYTSPGNSVQISGTACDDVGVTQVTWANNRGGSGVASGTTTWWATVGLQGGQNTITVTARDAAAKTAQDTIVVTYVVVAPAITSPPAATFTVNVPGSFTATATGTPVPALSLAGPKPAGISFTDNGNGTGTIAGTPAPGTVGVYSSLVLTAANGIAPNATQNVTITVNNPTPAITSISPSFVKPGSSGFTLTVRGAGFLSGASVRFNGVARTTTYVSAAELRVAVGAAEVARPGGFAVTAVNPSPTAGPSAPVAFTVGTKGKDFNNDGHSDVLWESADGWVAAWLMNGTSQVTNLLLYNYPVAVEGWHIVGTGDFNGDGQSDILWQSDSGYVAAWMMNGPTQVFNQLLYDYPVAVDGWRIAAAGDLDGDGISDILWQHDAGYVAYWLMGVRATGLSYQRLNALLDPRPVGAGGWVIAGTGDLNGDGKTDLVWQSADGYVAAWLMNGLSQIFSTLLYQAAVALDGWTVVGTADMNGDGMVDLLWQHRPLWAGDTSRGGVAAWFMNGVSHASTVPLTPAKVPDPSWRIVGPR